MKGIYRFQYDCGRMGAISGIFVADTADVEKINGHTVFFGEVLGKHSEIDVDIDIEENLILISYEPVDVEVFERLELATGYDPFDFWEGDDHGDHPDRPD
jgi:hypothetical protein